MADPTETTSSPARRLAWLLIGVLVGLSLLMVLPHGSRPKSTPPADGTAASVAARPSLPVDAGTPAAPEVVAALAARSVRPMNRANLAIDRGEDLHALAVQILERAESGHAEAQYSLYRIIDTCAYELTRFKDEAELAERRTELMERPSGYRGPAAAALEVEQYRMCDGFRADPIERFGDADDWLLRAVDAGHPLASVALAVELDRSSPDGAPLSDAERIARQRELFLIGLRSGRPEALWEGFAFDAGDPLKSEDRWSPAPEGMAWLLLACARGLECSRAARWRRELEAVEGIPPYEDWAEALMFDLPLHQRETALARARELAAALDRDDTESMLPAALRGATR